MRPSSVPKARLDARDVVLEASGAPLAQRAPVVSYRGSRRRPAGLMDYGMAVRWGCGGWEAKDTIARVTTATWSLRHRNRYVACWGQNNGMVYLKAVACAQFYAMKRKYCHFDDIFITACTKSCQNDNFWYSQWWICRQNDVSVSVLWITVSWGLSNFRAPIWTLVCVVMYQLFIFVYWALTENRQSFMFVN